MSQPNDLSRYLVSLEQDTTLIAVIELSHSSWLIAGTVPGVERQPLKKIVSDEAALLRLLHRWRDEAIGKGCAITRIAVAFEAGHDGFGLPRWLAKQGIDLPDIFPTTPISPSGCPPWRFFRRRIKPFGHLGIILQPSRVPVAMSRRFRVTIKGVKKPVFQSSS